MSETLRDKLKALTAHCREVDAEIEALFRGQNWTVWQHGRGTITDGRHVVCANAYTASLDATVDLVEREMPGRNSTIWMFHAGAAGRRTHVSLSGRPVIKGRAEASHNLPAVALLLALLEANEIE